jgi:hypothetical protein
MYSQAFAATVIVITASVAQAVSPSAALFKTTSHDFGTVARAAKTEFRFELTNPFDQPIHIAGVRASCGCTTPIVETNTIAPGQTGTILARFNTGSFSGARSATLTVSFDRPSYSEVQLHVKGYIRSDVVFNPGEANFGNIAEGAGNTLKMTIDYAGRNDWAILGMKTVDGFIKARAEEGKRSNGRVSYNLEIELAKDAPVGRVMSEVIIQTNDRNLKTIPLLVTGNVEAAISVSPQQIELTQDKASDSHKQIFILKGQAPFKVVDVESEDFDIEFSDESSEAKQVHTLPMTLRAKKPDQSFDGQILVKTDSEAMPLVKLNASYKAK